MLGRAAQSDEASERVPIPALNHALKLEGHVMKVFQIRQSATGAILWTGTATDAIAALDAMAHEAGYYDHGDIPDQLRAGGLSAEEIRV